MISLFQSFVLLFFASATVLSSSEPKRVVLVTGGAGYIGSHACKALKEAGYIPVSYDHLKRGNKESVKWGPLFVGDLLDVEALDKAFTLYKPFAVLHCAALLSVGESVTDPSSYYTNNIVGSINLLNAMVKHKVPHIIFSSSCTVYGNSQTPISEDHPKTPTNPYARSKHFVENVIVDYAHAYQLKYMFLRYFNAAGIETDAGLKRGAHSCNFLIPRAILTLIQNEESLQVFGSDYPTPDGTCIRDYVHVKDLARAHVLALQHLQEGKPSNEVNLGSGRGYSVLEILQKIEEVTGKKVPYDLKPRREGDVAVAVARVKNAKEILGFEPNLSDLHTIIESEWNSLQGITKDKEG